MTPQTRDNRPYAPKPAGIAAQPIALVAATLMVLVFGIGGILLARSYAGGTPEPDRTAVARQQQQARTAQMSEQLVEKTKGLEATQQESIDQLQMVQDQLQSMKRLIAAQQADSKRLSDQVAGLTESIDGLRQSFATAQASDPIPPPTTRNRAVRARAHASRNVHHRRKRS